ncbi:MAG: SEL1-like repeat protein [Opitutales bacterium]|nr:SEL1-like repeat protein [Opitutales bacterium]
MKAFAYTGNHSYILRFRLSRFLGGLLVGLAGAAWLAAGEATEAEEGRAYTFLLENAVGGNGEAQYALGKMYRRGQGVDANLAESVHWLIAAHQRGVSAAEAELEDLHDELLEQAEAGDTEAQAALGRLHGTGLGVESDNDEAMKWFSLAAEEGNAWAQNGIGFIYEHGRGVEVDDAEAVKWYRRAAEQGNPWAQRNLGARYLEGRGVDQDEIEAIIWFRLAADQGNTWGQHHLGELHESGNGIAEDPVMAFKWYHLAAVQGHEGAAKGRDRIRTQLTSEEIAKALQLSQNFQETIVSRAAEPEFFQD